jgi:hypothetical protein
MSVDRLSRIHNKGNNAVVVELVGGGRVTVEPRTALSGDFDVTNLDKVAESCEFQHRLDETPPRQGRQYLRG